MQDGTKLLPAARGLRVSVELVSDSGEIDALAFTIVEERQADFSAGFLGETTPMAQAVLGHTAGETLPYRQGDIRQVRITSVQVSDQAQTEDVSARREAVRRKAVRHSDFVNALIFAGSVNSKWGDYEIDPQKWDEEEQELR
jgi:hypothetical protein